MNRSITASFVRPSDTNVYAAGDEMNGTTYPPGLTFTKVFSRGTGLLLVGAMLIDSAAQATKLSSELWLFGASPGFDGDNAPFTPTDAELESLVAIIPFTTPYVGTGTAGEGGNVVFPATDMAKVLFRSATYTTSLFGVLVARNAYIPVSGEKFTVVLGLQE